MKKSLLFSYPVLAVLLAMALGGCGHQSVRHLSRNPWTFDTDQVLNTKFWRFEYEIVPMYDRFGVRGRAFINKKALPENYRWMEDMWFSAYLSDKKGKVLAHDIRVFLPRALDPGQGIDFEFVLKPTSVESGPLFISFGYRMVLTEGRFPKDKSIPFFASETALHL